MTAASANARLLARLLRPLERPGLVRVGLARRIGARAEAMRARLPLLARLEARRGTRAGFGGQDVPIVHAQPVRREVPPGVGAAGRAGAPGASMTRVEHVVVPALVVTAAAAMPGAETPGKVAAPPERDAAAAPRVVHVHAPPVATEGRRVVHVHAPAAAPTRAPVQASAAHAPARSDARVSAARGRAHAAASAARAASEARAAVEEPAPVRPRARTPDPVRPEIVHALGSAASGPQAAAPAIPAAGAPSNPGRLPLASAVTLAAGVPALAAPAANAAPSTNTPNAAAAPNAARPPRIDIDAVAEQVQRRLMRQLAQERTRRGHVR